MSERAFGLRTKAIHAGARPDPETGSRAVPIYQTAGYVFENSADAGDLFALQKYGNTYSRIGNPTVAAFEERIASLEGGIGAVAFASGLAAEFAVFAALTGSGDHIVAAAGLYGGTVTQLDVTLRRFGVETTFVDGTDPADYAAAIEESTKLIFAEVIGNPSGEIADLEGLAAVAHAHDIPLVIDATMATPWLNRPIEFGADIVVHSATKFLGGHGSTLGGVVVESGRFDWGSGKFPQMTEPSPAYGGLSWWGNFGEYGFLTKLRSEQLRDIGGALAPQSAFTLIQGVETLPQRMDAHVANARTVAQWLKGDPRIAYVKWAGLQSHPHHDRASKYLPAGPGAVFAFGVTGGPDSGQEQADREQEGQEGAEQSTIGRRFVESLRLASHVANIGDVRTLVIHPASTTHRQLTDDQLRSAGVGPELIRISVGLEDAADIVWDLDQALTVATGRSRS